MKKRLIISLIVMLTIVFILLIFKSNIIYIGNKLFENKNKLMVEDGFKISSPAENTILITISRENGIDKIEHPNGYIISCNGKNTVGIDLEVESQQEYVFKTTDVNGNETYDSFITPVVNVQITKNDVNTNLENLKQTIEQQLLDKNIATNFINLDIGEQNRVNSETQNVATIFKNWKSFGDGNWGYSTANKWIYNTKNSSYLTGFYDPQGNYETIELSFQARTTDADDDIIGSAIRFTENETGVYNSYLFLLDRHDTSGKGVWNGEVNGITKLNTASFSNSNLTKLSVNPSLRWTRNTWQSYKFTAKGSTIEAYLDGKLVASATDDSITTGSYGFVSYSQAYTYFRNIVVTTVKSYTLTEVIANKTWLSEEINIVINLNNQPEALLQDENCIELFNTNNIHYIGVGNDDNKEEIEQFITNIQNRGMFEQSSDMDNSIIEIVN